MKTLRSLLLVSCLLACPLAQAQELNAKVSINREQVSNTKSEVFESLQEKLTRFLNERTWTSLKLRENECIQCSFNLTVNTYSDSDNQFKCSLTLNAVRPVYQSAYTTTIFSFEDGQVEFTFSAFDQLEWRDDQVDNNLTAIFAFYAYYIIGLTMDSMSPSGGTAYLQLAKDICSAADGLGTGWKAFGESKNRYALINDYMDGSMTPMREFHYTYYRTGLDQMSEGVEAGREAVLAALYLLADAHEAKSMSSLPTIFTDIKRDEVVSIFTKQGEASMREEVYNLLFKLNPSQNNYWEKIKQ